MALSCSAVSLNCSNERAEQLLELGELPGLADFLANFESSVDIVMEGDRVWPPERAQPY